MGNTANFEGGTLYAPQSVLTFCGDFLFFFKQNKDEDFFFFADLTTRPHASISDKDCLIQRWNDAKCCRWS